MFKIEQLLLMTYLTIGISSNIVQKRGFQGRDDFYDLMDEEQIDMKNPDLMKEGKNQYGMLSSPGSK
jgi:hypothetical protein